MIQRRAAAITAAGCIMGLLVPLFWAALGARAQENPVKVECRLFRETGYNLCGRFLQYWQQHGGLAQHGYPISDPVGEVSAVDGKLYTVQYFERAVFELHPENPPPHDVLLSLLGAFRYAAKYLDGVPGQQPNTSPGARTFEQTGHTVGGGFLDYWTAQGGLDRFGYPLSDEFTEISDLNGEAYVVQYFERAVLEYHPENLPEGRILLSQLGTFRFRDQSITLTWVPAPVPVPAALEERPESMPEIAQPALTLEGRIDRYISKLTPAQQIGHLIMIPVFNEAYSPVYDTYLQQYQIANAIIFTTGGGSVRPATLDGLRGLTRALVVHSPNPMLIAMDEEGGLVDRLAPYYGYSPSPASLLVAGDPRKAYAQGGLAAGRLRDAGVNVNFAPLADVYQGGAIDRSRMFGTTPAQVTQYAGAFLDGLQQNGVAGTLKHWPGLGAANANPDVSLPTIYRTQAQLNATDFRAFRDLLAHEPGMVMATHVMVPAYDTQYPASLSPTLIDGVLRGQLGYEGVVVSDAMVAGAVREYMHGLGYQDGPRAAGEAAVLAILAGEDIIECPGDGAQVAGTVQALTQAVRSGRITQDRLRLSLQRILTLKAKLGLFSFEF